jgi:hypothetical protein
MAARLGSPVSKPGKHGTLYLFRRFFVCEASLLAGDPIRSVGVRWAYDADDQDSAAFRYSSDEGWELVAVAKLYWPLGENRHHDELDKPSAWCELQEGSLIRCAPLHLQPVLEKWGYT